MFQFDPSHDLVLTRHPHRTLRLTFHHLQLEITYPLPPAHPSVILTGRGYTVTEYNFYIPSPPRSFLSFPIPPPPLRPRLTHPNNNRFSGFRVFPLIQQHPPSNPAFYFEANDLTLAANPGNTPTTPLTFFTHETMFSHLSPPQEGSPVNFTSG